MNASTCVGARYTLLRIVIQSGKIMFIGCSDIPHPLENILSCFIVQHVVYERSGCGYVSGTFTDEKFLRNRRLLDSRDVVLIVPHKISPMLWSPEIKALSMSDV